MLFGNITIKGYQTAMQQISSWSLFSFFDPFLTPFLFIVMFLSKVFYTVHHCARFWAKSHSHTSLVLSHLSLL